jgi:beta-glucosidase/6-phospho-beta-glucosidase/beta-galactosidase
MITLFHWDLPDGLDKRYGGLLSKEEFPKDFAHYAKVVFEAIPKCKHWITFNEPWCSAVLGYNTGFFAPGRTSDRSKSKEGDSARECWTVGHNILLAHGAAVKVYREKFKPKDGGEIGITLNGRYVIFHGGPSNKQQAMLHIPGIPMTRRTSKPAIGKSNLPSPGSLTPSISAITQPQCANNSAIGFPNSHPKKQH